MITEEEAFEMYLKNNYDDIMDFRSFYYQLRQKETKSEPKPSLEVAAPNGYSSRKVTYKNDNCFHKMELFIDGVSVFWSSIAPDSILTLDIKKEGSNGQN